MRIDNMATTEKLEWEMSEDTEGKCYGVPYS